MDSSRACYLSWLPSDGAEDCHACCFPATRRRLAKKKHTPKPQTVWEGFSLHPGIPLGVIAVIMFLCAGFLKLMEKFAKTVLFGTFLAEAVFCLYLGFAGKFEAGRAFWFTIIALAVGIYVAVMRKKIAKAGDCVRATHYDCGHFDLYLAPWVGPAAEEASRFLVEHLSAV